MHNEDYFQAFLVALVLSIPFIVETIKGITW
jgi:hypothetical protein